MKRFGQFSLLLIAFILIVYAEPIVFPNKEVSTTIKPVEEADVTVSHTSFPYGEIRATGVANYIGKKPQELTKLYGESLEIQETDLGYEWWILGENDEDYVQVAVRDNKISSVFVLGKNIDAEPFKLGMSLTDIAEVTTIYSNFDFDYKNSHYKLELSEEDMNYQPLVAFDNGTFAILHLDQSTGELLGIRYLNKEVLVNLMPYQLNEGTIELVAYSRDTNWEIINDDRERQLQTILNLLRQRNGLKPYVYQPELKRLAEKSLAQFIANPHKILTEDERLADWENEESHHTFNEPFSLNQKEFDKLLTTSKIGTEGIRGLVYTPNYDVPFLALSWYSESVYKPQFVHENDSGVAAIFADNIVLLLFAEREMSELLIKEKTDSSSLTETTSTTEVLREKSQEE